MLKRWLYILHVKLYIDLKKRISWLKNICSAMATVHCHVPSKVYKIDIDVVYS